MKKILMLWVIIFLSITLNSCKSEIESEVNDSSLSLMGGELLLDLLVIHGKIIHTNLM